MEPADFIDESSAPVNGGTSSTAPGAGRPRRADLARRRGGLGYQLAPPAPRSVIFETLVPVLPAPMDPAARSADRASRAARRQRQRALPRPLRPPALRRVAHSAAAMLLGPSAMAAAASTMTVPSAPPTTGAPLDSPTANAGTTTTSTSNPVGDAATATTTSAPATTTPGTTPAPATPTSLTSAAAPAATAGAPTTTTATTTSAPTTATTALAGPTPTAASPATGVPVTSTSTSISTSTSTTVPASTTTTVVAQPATEPLPVGPAIVPTDAAAGDSTATLAADALRFHRATEQAINELAWIGLARQLAADKVRDLTARVTQLNTTAIDLARRGAPTAETAVLRAHAVADLDAARLDEAGLALRLASAENIVDAARTDYERARGALSAAVAASGSVDGTTLDAKWATTTPERLDVVFAALTRVGAPYVFGAVGPDTFDCSGLTAFAWQAAGVSLAHYTVTQRTSTLAVPSDALQAGDLVFNLNGPDGGHVMMYLGAGQAVVEARSPGTKVQVSTWHVVTGFGSPLADVPAEPADGRNALPSATSIVTGSLGDAASAVVDTTATRR